MPHEKNAIIREAHFGTAGGHFAGKPTAQKILDAGLWWPTLHKDTNDFLQMLRYLPEGRKTLATQ